MRYVSIIQPLFISRILRHSNVLIWKSFTIFSISDSKNDIGLNDMMREFLVEQENFFATKAKKEIQ